MNKTKNKTNDIIKIILNKYPGVQAIYLFGSYETPDEQLESDVDIAILFSPQQSKEIGSLVMSDLVLELETVLHKKVDLINLRTVNTVFQKEIVTNTRRIYCQDEYAADEFEMLVFSKYQKLEEERKEIIEAILKSGRILNI